MNPKKEPLCYNYESLLRLICKACHCLLGLKCRVRGLVVQGGFRDWGLIRVQGFGFGV